MRYLLVLTLLLCQTTAQARGGHIEKRELSLDAQQLSVLQIESAQGFVDVVGEPGLDQIRVTATIEIPRELVDRADTLIAEDMDLSLESNKSTALLRGLFRDSMWQWGESPGISLTVRVPARMALEIEDGSGYISIRDVDGDITIEDGSGSIELLNAGGQVDIEDGSGSIEIESVNGDVSIIDGSGGIDIVDIKGSVSIDDGSGSVDIHDVSEDLIIVDDGSGDLRYSDIGGAIEDRS